MAMDTPRTYDARAVANYFLDLAKAEGIPITPMGLQKLVYFAHGWMLAFYGRPLISDRIEAWDYGPVIPVLYHQFKRFGNLPITEPALDVLVAPGIAPRLKKPEIPKYEDPDAARLLDQVWDAYKGFTGIQLSNMTHAPGSPWSQARKSDQPFIDDESIKRYFVSLPK